jgi:IS605 OrfB family transposase
MADQSKIVSVKTAVFKLHNPSQRKRAMLDYALLQNHLAYTKALRTVAPLIKKFVADELAKRLPEKSLPAKEQRSAAQKRKRERNDELAKAIRKVINPLPLPSSAKAHRSIIGSIIGQVESHLELHAVQGSVGFPTVQPLKDTTPEYRKALHALANAATVEAENAARDEIHRVAKFGKFRPLILATNRVSDGFLLLRSLDERRYFAWLNLVPEKSRFARLTEAEQKAASSRHVRDMVNVRTGEIVKFKSKTGCLFPLEFGRDFQGDQFLIAGSPLSAKLIKKGDDFEVHIAFEFKCEKIEANTFLGVDRGIYNLASASVIDKDGRVLDHKNIDGRNLRLVQKALERRQRILQKRGKRFTGRSKKHAADEAVHVTANEIVELAQKYRSQIYMENLSPLVASGKKRKRSSFNRLLNRSQYQKLQRVLAYKLSVAGLPATREVHPGYTSQACPICGHISRDNRAKLPEADGFRTHEFRCVQCGYSQDADLNASRNIALKRLWRESLSPALARTPFKDVPESKSFSAFLRLHAERRGESAYDRKVGSFGRSGLDAQFEDGEVAPDGNIDEPRSGPNTPASKNPSSKLSAISPSGENSLLQSPTRNGAPDG